jgi:hypothetical protein
MKHPKLTPEEITQWFHDAIADGFTVKAIYPGCETIDTAALLEKDGWSMHIMRRDNYKDISIWGPDSLAVRVPSRKYDFKSLVKGLRYCEYCNTENVKTERISFAGRCCSKCRKDPELTRTMEPPGWTN